MTELNLPFNVTLKFFKHYDMSLTLKQFADICEKKNITLDEATEYGRIEYFYTEKLIKVYTDSFKLPFLGSSSFNFVFEGRWDSTPPLSVVILSINSYSLDMLSSFDVLHEKIKNLYPELFLI